MKKFAAIAAMIIILGITAFLIARIPGIRAGSKTVIPDTTTVAAGTTEEWLGVFLQGQRVGYSVTKTTRGPEGTALENKTLITLNMMNTIRTLTTHAYIHTAPDYTLKDFIIEIATAGHPTKIEGILNGQVLTLTSYSQGIPQTQDITLKEKPYFPDAMEEVIKSRRLKPGDVLKVPYFDPTTQSSATATLKVYPKSTTQVLGREVAASKVEIDFMGMISELWFDDDYRLVKNYSPNLGLEMIPLSKTDALAEIEPANAFDLLSFFAVRLEKPIEPDVNLTKVVLELKDITAEGLDLSDDYQKMTATSPIILELVRPDLEKIPVQTIPIKGQAEYLRPSVYIQCDHPDIIKASEEILAGETDARRAVARLTEGVYRMLRKNPTASLPSALDVLKTKEGDCNEHAILFAALARAAGIPTKIYVGLINLYGDAYWYHAWCAVWLGTWVPVDPTFNQFPANLYHLKLKEGELSEQAKVLRVVGKLKIEILQYQ